MSSTFIKIPLNVKLLFNEKYCSTSPMVYQGQTQDFMKGGGTKISENFLTSKKKKLHFFSSTFPPEFSDKPKKKVITFFQVYFSKILQKEKKKKIGRRYQDCL